MSEALSLSDRIAARLERLAEMDLAAAEHVHAQLVASTEPKVTADLSRAYQRASRTLRQTLMLQMKHAREQAAPPAPAAKRAGRPRLDDEATYERLITSRLEHLQDAVGRVTAAAHPDAPKRQRETLDRLDVELDDWLLREDFLMQHFSDQVVEVCQRLGLPMALARRWDQLPRPAATFDPATAPSPIPDTG